MAGRPFQVGRFAHTLRIRLMREHLGVDVDAMYEEDLMAANPLAEENDMEPWDPDQQQEFGAEHGVTQISKRDHRGPKKTLLRDTVDAIEQGKSRLAPI